MPGNFYSETPADELRRVKAELSRERALCAGIVQAGQKVLIGGNHLALLIGPDHPSHTASYDEAQEHYFLLKKQPDLYETWCAWKAIMEFRSALSELEKQA